MTLVTVEIWTGSNFIDLVRKISEINTETTIRIIGKRIIIQDHYVNYYQNIVIGDMVEIPIYPECLICDELEEEIALQPKYTQSDWDVDAKMKEWGLLPP